MQNRKLILALLFSTLILTNTSCSNQKLENAMTKINTIYKEQKEKERFEITYTQGLDENKIQIIKDKKTGIEYIQTSSGITPLINN